MLSTNTGRYKGPALRHVELDIDIGADAKDWSAIQATEKLKPVETELRRVEELVQEIVREMDYLRSRELRLRDTNESTNNRVKWFGLGTTTLLIALWVWQILYLRAYFRYVLYSHSFSFSLEHRRSKLGSVQCLERVLTIVPVLTLDLSISFKHLIDFFS